MLKGSRLLAVLPTLGRPWNAKVLATEALVGAANAPTRGHVLESLVAHRLIDLESEWHLHHHRYEHSANEIYLAKTALTSKNIVYLCLDLLLDRNAALFRHLKHIPVKPRQNKRTNGQV